MDDIERHNQQAIDMLNQRGGRMLSLVDLLDAGTVGLDMAAEMARVAAGGGSFLTAAGPGGVGKTTLMGALLAFCPPGTRIVTVEGPRTLARLTGDVPDGRECLVVHEIGSGSYYGYLWGNAVARYIELGSAPARSLASNVHAETYRQAVEQLTARPLGVAPEAMDAVDLLAFMDAEGGKRRVTSVWLACPPPGRGHEMAWRRSRRDDAFERLGPPPDRSAAHGPGGDAGAVEVDVARCRDFLARARADGCTLMEDLRRRALAELFGG